MSDLFEGYVTVRRLPPPAMVLLRTDIGAAKVKTAIRKAAGIAPPPARRIETSGEISLAWMSPDELLLIGPEGQGAALAAALAGALKGHHHLAADVSDMRAMWEIEGEAVREVLAKLSPADTARLPVGEIRRSRLAQVAAAFWLTAETRARIVAFRSVAGYVTDLLAHSARPGSEVG